VSDRDDALRKELGWTGPEESNYEPAPVEPTFTPAATPLPSRPPVDYEPPEPLPPQERQAPQAPPPPPPPPAPPREPERPDAGTRPPQRFGPPPGTPRDTGAFPAQGRGPESPQQWAPQPPNPQQPGWQQGRPPRPAPPQGPPQYGTWQGQSQGPDSRVAPPPPTGSYADRIRADDLVPSRRIVPARGWRRAVYKATFGLVNPGQSPDEMRQAELEARIKVVLRGHYKVGVMGKGGVGKTTVSASIGSVFAELRQEDRVVAMDADTAFGKLGSRVDPKAIGSYWELAGDQHLETFADVRSRVGNNSAGLFVLAGEGSPARRRVLDPAIYREAAARLDRYFSITIVDCSSTMDTPVTQEVLRDLDALVVVSSPWVDGAAAAGQTMDWLANRGLTSLLRRTVVVLNDSDGHADKRTRAILAQQFAGQGQVVVEVPFDPHLRPGGVIEGTAEMSAPTRRKFIEIAAALAEHFPANDERGRDRH
jgi:MinD-like ATPase involved in chromosome partitioning or flagellar assembly